MVILEHARAQTRGPRTLSSLWLCVAIVILVPGFGAEAARAIGCPPNTATFQVTIPINSPPLTPTTLFFGDGDPNAGKFFTSFNVSSSRSWARITSVQPTSVSGTGPDSETVSVSFNVADLAAGSYCAIFSGDGTSAEYQQLCSPGNQPCCPGATVLEGSLCVYQNPISAQIVVQVGITESAGSPYLADPVPNLLSGNAVMSNPLGIVQLLSSAGAVSGVAADGVTQAVIAVPISPSLCNCIQPGDQIQLTLFNDQGLQSSLSNEDGGLGLLGATSFSRSQVTATAVNPGSSMSPYYAFAVYLAPMDFARPLAAGGFKNGSCGSVTNTGDDQLICRSVSVQIRDVTANITIGTVPITVVRPPVILIHGLWGNENNWDNFGPLDTGPKHADSRFSVGRYNFDYSIDNQINTTTSNPTFLNQAGVSANTLGFQYNAVNAYGFIWDQIKNFKQGVGNYSPTGLVVASVQADIVGHSMGGDIARTIAALPQFLNDPDPPKATFGQGNIHKLITIDTPHLGSPLASSLLNPANSCTRNFLANNAYNFSFISVSLTGTSNSSCGNVSNAACGAIGDLSPSSPALNTINSTPQQPHPLPTALIAGIYLNFASLDQSAIAAGLRGPLGCPNDPLAQSLTSDGWPDNFGVAGSNQNDAIVPLSSQLNTSNPNPGASLGFQFSGYVHSAGTRGLGFIGPSVLDAGIVAPNTISIPNQVINLLNTLITNQTAFVPLNP